MASATKNGHHVLNITRIQKFEQPPLSLKGELKFNSNRAPSINCSPSYRKKFLDTDYTLFYVNYIAKICILNFIVLNDVKLKLYPTSPPIVKNHFFLSYLTNSLSVTLYRVFLRIWKKLKD